MAMGLLLFRPGVLSVAWRDKEGTLTIYCTVN